MHSALLGKKNQTDKNAKYTRFSTRKHKNRGDIFMKNQRKKIDHERNELNTRVCSAAHLHEVVCTQTDTVRMM